MNPIQIDGQVISSQIDDLVSPPWPGLGNECQTCKGLGWQWVGLRHKNWCKACLGSGDRRQRRSWSLEKDFLEYYYEEMRDQEDYDDRACHLIGEGLKADGRVKRKAWGKVTERRMWDVGEDGSCSDPAAPEPEEPRPTINISDHVNVHIHVVDVHYSGMHDAFTPQSPPSGGWAQKSAAEILADMQAFMQNALFHNLTETYGKNPSAGFSPPGSDLPPRPFLKKTP